MSPRKPDDAEDRSGAGPLFDLRTAPWRSTRQATPLFDGATFDEKLDGKRLERQLIRVRDLMLDGQWRTLAEVEDKTFDPQSSISARLRDLRKPRFGAWTVERRRRTRGLYEYRIAPENPA